MFHEIDAAKSGPHADSMSKAIEACVHCGFCLPACPTYRVEEEEMDSPRGRIYLMKGALEETLELEQVLPYVDRCLGCVGCMTACPSGVKYDQLITPFRAWAAPRRNRSWGERLSRMMILSTLPYPARFRWSMRLGRIAKPLSGLLPARMRGMLAMIPEEIPTSQTLPEIYPAKGARRARVALLAGCAQQVLAPEINWATLRILAREGVEVVIPKEQSCCGALGAHTGSLPDAKRLARNNFSAFPKDVDAVVTNAAGCGSGMHEYPVWFAGDSEHDQAEELAHRTHDVCQFLNQLGTQAAYRIDEPLSVAYQDACHLAHAQGVRSAPRALLGQIENLQLVEIADSDVCCGSAGSYNLEQPEIARELGQRKADSILATGADAVASGNIGCIMQIRTHLREKAPAGGPPVYHTVQLLDMAHQADA